MSAPALSVNFQGIGAVDADLLNTYVQSCDTVAQLRAFIGISGVSVITRGQLAPGDGFGAYYEWSGGSSAADNGISVIKPTGGASLGRWVAVVLGGSGGGSSSPYLTSAIATQALAAGSFINIYSNSGVAAVQNAQANSVALFANGFVLTSVPLGGVAEVTLLGLNSAISASVVTPGQVWLDPANAGGFTYTPPSTTGQIVQPLGIAIPAVGVVFTPQPTVLL